MKRRTAAPRIEPRLLTGHAARDFHDRKWVWLSKSGCALIQSSSPVSENSTHGHSVLLPRTENASKTHLRASKLSKKNWGGACPQTPLDVVLPDICRLRRHQQHPSPLEPPFLKSWIRHCILRESAKFTISPSYSSSSSS